MKALPSLARTRVGVEVEVEETASTLFLALGALDLEEPPAISIM